MLSYTKMSQVVSFPDVGLLSTGICAGDFGIRFRHGGPPLPVTTVSSKLVGSRWPAQQQQGRWAGPASTSADGQPSQASAAGQLGPAATVAMSTKQHKLLLGRQRRKARTSGPVRHKM